MTMEEAEHRGKVIGANLSHFFFWGWKASTVSSAEGSWPEERKTTRSSWHSSFSFSYLLEKNYGRGCEEMWQQKARN